MKKKAIATEVADYPRALWMPTTHFDGGVNKPRYVILHGTGFDPNQTAQGVANDFATTNPNSAHFAIDRAGVVVQMVRLRDAAWCNGVIQPGADPWWKDDPNQYTISIEHVNDSNNSLAPTPAQMASSFALVAWLCKTLGIPARKADASGGITGHFSITPQTRAHCPGNYPFADLFSFLEGAVNMQPWLAPGAVALSEFARQTGGNYKHGTCVEAAAEECAIAQHPAFRLPANQVGDFLAQMVAQWHAADPGGVDPVSGASSYVDATNWLRGLGFRVDENVFDPSNWWEVLVSGLEQHSVFLVGVTNAQGLHGDEPGVHNHGLAALGIDPNGNIICGDPDNQAANENMPGNPYGAFVIYTKEDLANGAVSSLTRVYPMSLSISDVSAYFSETDATHWKCLQTGKTVQLGILQAYREWPANGSLAGLTALGLPETDEQYPKPNTAVQKFERGLVAWDPSRLLDDPPGAVGSVYLLKDEPAPAPAPAPTPPPSPTPGPAIPPDLHGALAAVLQLLQPAQQAANEVAQVMKELGF